MERVLARNKNIKAVQDRENSSLYLSKGLKRKFKAKYPKKPSLSAFCEDMMREAIGKPKCRNSRKKSIKIG